MAKSRMIRPDTWTDDKFVAMSPLARLLFIGMWNFACDNGHLDDSSVQLKMRIFPAEECSTESLLNELLKTGVVVRENGYLKVVNLATKQPLDMRYLVFCDHCDNDPARRWHDEDKVGRQRAPKVRPTGTRSAPKGGTGSAPRSGVGDGDGDGNNSAAASAADRFDEFYNLYPRHEAPGNARKAWKAALKKADADTIIDALTAQLPTIKKSERKFIALPASWLNAERWLDEAPTTTNEEHPYAHIPRPTTDWDALRAEAEASRNSGGAS